jgi:NAD(P)-dependent dehydrogenase (short-subunit alcohol dehydrogenase family)
MTAGHAMGPLGGKVAVVTGAASGIGYALVQRFAQEGMRVVLADVEKLALDEAAEQLRSAGYEVLSVLTDVSRAEDVERLAASTYEAFGAAHILCNNAGVVKSARAWELTIDDWRWLIDVNLWGVIHGVRAFVPRMLAQQEPCHVVNTASVVALLTLVNKAAYAAAKAGVVGLSESLQVDLDADAAPIGVSVLLPGFIPTKITESDRNRPGQLADAAARSSASSIGGLTSTMTAAEVAELVLDAIKRRRFWVNTHAAYEPLIVARAQAVGTDVGPIAAPVW